jgi:hypothetical protein
MEHGNEILGPDDMAVLRRYFDQPGRPSVIRITGLLAAVVSGPSHVGDERWLPVAVEGRAPGEDVHQRLLRLGHGTRVRYEEGILMLPDPVHEAHVARWCAGYLQGLGLHDEWILTDRTIEHFRRMFALCSSAIDDVPEVPPFLALVEPGHDLDGECGPFCPTVVIDDLPVMVMEIESLCRQHRGGGAGRRLA